MNRSIAAVSLCCGMVLTVLAQQPPRARPAAAKASTAAAKAAAKGDTAPPSADTNLGLKFGPNRPPRVTPDDQSALANGARILVAENHEIPSVNIHVFLPAGSALDPAGKAGLADATALVVRTGGTESLTASSLPDRLAELGAVVDSRVAENRAEFLLQTPRQALAETAAIFRDLLLAPRLDPEAVDTTFGRMHEDIGQRNRNPIIGVSRVFRSRLYDSGTPWGRMPEYDTLDNLSRPDIESFYRKYYGPERAVFVVEGDITAAEAKAKMQELFGGWKASGAAPAPAAEESKPVQSALLFSDRDDARIATFVVGHRGGKLADDDYPAMLLICDLLSAGPWARLQTRVRNSGGWRAEWTASWDAGFERPGEFRVGAAVDPPFVTQSIVIVREELAKLREGNITEQELETARTHLLMQMALRYQSNEEQARDRGAALFHGQPTNFLERAFQGIASATREDVVRAAAKNIQPEQIIAVVGRAALFDKPLSTISANVETVEWKAPTARPMRPRTDAASLERGKEMLHRMQAALGGREKLAAIRDMSIRQEGTTLFNERPAHVKLLERWLTGDVYRQDQDFGVMSQAIFYNGKIAWIARPGVVAPLPPPGVAIVRHELFRLLFLLALSDGNPARQVADLGGNVMQITEGDTYGVRVYLDPATSLPQRLIYRIQLGDNSMAVEESLSDWKDFNGIKWPSKVSIKKNGRRTDDMTTVEAKFNSKLAPAELEKKP